MRLPAFPVFLLLAFLAVNGSANADTAEVLIQAGHEGRPQSCAEFHVKACNLGAAAAGIREPQWTVIVADETARALRADGVSVLRRPADWAGGDHVREAVFLHFDGASACASGASIGFPATTSRAFVDAWERAYRAWFPFRFVGENFTENERRYYGFHKVDAPEKLLIEFGELTCPAQRAWMEPRLHQMGDRLAAFLSARLQK
ncbi:MAG TPA: hypothetical protein VE591_06195 [Candidatus Acidoferrum sp.]|nr:hypothetical protein [Candidatus Acidoferrum sp.]